MRRPCHRIGYRTDSRPCRPVEAIRPGKRVPRSSQAEPHRRKDAVDGDLCGIGSRCRPVLYTDDSTFRREHEYISRVGVQVLSHLNTRFAQISGIGIGERYDLGGNGNGRCRGRVRSEEERIRRPPLVTTARRQRVNVAIFRYPPRRRRRTDVRLVELYG